VPYAEIERVTPVGESVASDAPEASVASEQEAQQQKTHEELPRTYTNSVGMEFILVPSGNFMMGGDPNFEETSSDEQPRHNVNIRHVFYLGKHEVTQGQWAAVMGDNPSEFQARSNPVENVTWNDIQEFVRRLNEMESTTSYRLPSEAEWEYAARAGTTTKWYFGDDKSYVKSYAWIINNSGQKTRPVGQLKANAWGFHDMHGNVREFVHDCYHADYADAPDDGSAWMSDDCTSPVGRDCSWKSSLLTEELCRSADRSNIGSREFGSEHFGFRIAKTAP